MHQDARTRAAVLALHFQNDVLHPDGRIALGLARQPEVRDALIAAAGRLLAAARAAAVPVIAVRIAFAPDYRDVPEHVPILLAAKQAGAMAEGSWGAQFYAPLAPLADENVLTHNRVNAFFGTGLDRLLAGQGVGRLILAGVATNSVVEHSARHAADMGFEVIAAQDACASARSDLHTAALENIRLIGRVMPVSDIIDDWGNP